jgi:hypothetical protein
MSILVLRDRPSGAVDSACRPAYRFLSNGGHAMSVMCSLAACKAQEGLCGHEKVMFGIALLAAVGFSVYAMLG